YVSHSGGVSIYQLTADRQLRELTLIDRLQLQGTPHAIEVVGDSLWIVMTDSRRVVEVELMSGEYRIVRGFATVDQGGNRIKPRDILVKDESILVSTGTQGTVILYQADADGGAVPVASLNLAYLVRHGDIYAGQMVLRGQTLYVASGQGDLQLYDISPWLEGRYKTTLTLRHYFSVTGDVTTLAFHPRALYAGSTFPYAGDQPTENPVENANVVNHLGGRLNTIVNDLLVITGHIPSAEGRLPATAAIEIQFNRLLDAQQLAAHRDDLLNVTLNGAKVAGLVSSQVNNSGTKLLFRPTNGFIDGQRYRVTLSGALRDLHGKTLGGDYSFRFTASSHEQPVLAEIRPEFASWRGEVPITVYGANFSDATELFLAGQPVEASRIQRVSANELRFSLPALAQSPADNQVVGLQVRNGELVDSRHAAFTYIADPQIDKIGAYDRVTRVHDGSRRNFLFNSGEVVAVEGRGFSPLTQVTINGKTASDVVLEGTNLLSFRLPGNTLGQLHMVLSNVEPTV